MIWIVLAILVVGYFIYKAIIQSTNKNVEIANYKIKNSPEYQKKYKASLDFVDFSDEYYDILENKFNLEIRLLSNKTLKASVKEYINFQIKQFESQRKDLSDKFNQKYDGDIDDPRHNLSTDEYIQTRFSQNLERQKEINELSNQISELKIQQ